MVETAGHRKEQTQTLLTGFELSIILTFKILF